MILCVKQMRIFLGECPEQKRYKRYNKIVNKKETYPLSIETLKSKI